MCLDSVTKRWYLFSDKNKYIGYKVFTFDNDDGMLRNGVNYNFDTYQVGKEYMADGFWHFAGPLYRYGFHICDTLADLEQYWGKESLWNKYRKVYKVEYSHVVAKGIQTYANVIVAKKMTLLEEVNVNAL